MENERWNDIPGWVGVYQVSNIGRVKNIRRTPPRFMSQHQGRGGYLRVSLGSGDERKIYPTHRLVLMAFVGPCPAGYESRHLDGNPKNNNLSNICWGTKQENMADRDRHGRTIKGNNHPARFTPGWSVGERNGNARLGRLQVINIRRLAGSGITHKELSKRFRVKEPAIWKIVNRQTWKHLEKQNENHTET